jgi:N-acetylglucosaminyldiphosphoundecaprenol N-acetyl-beta-D-mannosaminyltransferase
MTFVATRNKANNLNIRDVRKGVGCVKISQVHVDLFTVDELLEYVTESVWAPESRIITYANVNTANLAVRSEWFKRFLEREVSATFCDGIGLLIGARILGHKVRSEWRMTAPDFFDQFAELCSTKGLSVYLLAGQPGVADIAIARVKSKIPSLVIHGHHGFFNKAGPDNQAVIDDINRKAPDILCLGFGSPLQEAWIVQNRDQLKVQVYLPLGAWLDFYSGSTWRGPRWLTDNGAEWLCRMVTNPRRLWKRYLVGNPRFIIRVLSDRAWSEVQRVRRAVIN